jgi:heterodisulfide reductase subunit C
VTVLLREPFQAHDSQLEPRAEVEYCLQCAVCGLVCVVNQAEAYDPRHTFVYDLFNQGIEAKETLWGCPTCHKCEERCPYDFRPLELVKAHKEAALAAGLAPEAVYGELESLLSTGSAFPGSSVTERRRSKLGLPDLPARPVNELAIIAEHTGLAGRLAAARQAQRLKKEEGESNA